MGEHYKLPDSSAVTLVSLKLPEDHWLYKNNPDEPPAPMRTGAGPRRDELAEAVRSAARYAIRASTMSGRAEGFDPDAMVQNFIVGMLGYWTKDGKSTCL